MSTVQSTSMHIQSGCVPSAPTATVKQNALIDGCKNITLPQTSFTGGNYLEPISWRNRISHSVPFMWSDVVFAFDFVKCKRTFDPYWLFISIVQWIRSRTHLMTTSVSRSVSYNMNRPLHTDSHLTELCIHSLSPRAKSTNSTSLWWIDSM